MSDLDKLACKAAYVAQLCKEHRKIPRAVTERTKALADLLDEIATQLRCIATPPETGP